MASNRDSSRVSPGDGREPAGRSAGTYEKDTGNDNNIDIGILASRLETEFRRALEGVETLKAFTTEIYKLLHLLGFSEFTFLHWMPGGHYHRLPPKPLLTSTSPQSVNKVLSYLVDTASGQINTDLLNIHYQETDSPLYPPNSTVRRGCYTLTTCSRNYAYLIRKCGQTSSCQQVLCIVNDSKNSQEFKFHIEEHLLALDAITRVIETVGQDRFADLYKVEESDAKINIGSKPLRLISMIAIDDLTIGQAAERLCISVDTANKHIAKVKSELSLTTLPSAVFYATNKGLIDRII